MKDDQPPLFNALRTHLGGDIAAALPILLNGLPASSIDELVSLAERLEQKRAWSLVFPTWIELIRRFQAVECPERESYFWNDLGLGLLHVGDRRAAQCFKKALSLTSSPGRKMRTIFRLALYHVWLLRDWDRAAQFFQAGIVLGDRRGCNPLHVQQAKMHLQEIELDRRGMSVEFAQARWNIEQGRMACSAQMAKLELPC
jgi:hypothetical protein